MELTYREMRIEDYEDALALWKRTEGMGLSQADSQEAIGSYLRRNPGMSFICKDHDRLVGTVMGGHDGRRGFLYHAAVDVDYRGRSIGKHLVTKALSKLRYEGIDKCHLMVIADNEIGRQFWTSAGWERREGILLYSSST